MVVQDRSAVFPETLIELAFRLPNVLAVAYEQFHSMDCKQQGEFPTE